MQKVANYPREPKTKKNDRGRTCNRQQFAPMRRTLFFINKYDKSAFFSRLRLVILFLLYRCNTLEEILTIFLFDIFRSPIFWHLDNFDIRLEQTWSKNGFCTSKNSLNIMLQQHCEKFTAFFAEKCLKIVQIILKNVLDFKQFIDQFWCLQEFVVGQQSVILIAERW